jgi:hypothetical protein
MSRTSSSLVKTAFIMTAAALLVGSGLALHAVHAQDMTGIKRTDLQRHDLSAPGREVIQVRVDFDPGARQAAPHAGEVTVLRGAR